MEAERAPHRWAQGLKCSVPVDRLETKAPGGWEWEWLWGISGRWGGRIYTALTVKGGKGLMVKISGYVVRVGWLDG